MIFPHSDRMIHYCVFHRMCYQSGRVFSHSIRINYHSARVFHHPACILSHYARVFQHFARFFPQFTRVLPHSDRVFRHSVRVFRHSTRIFHHSSCFVHDTARVFRHSDRFARHLNKFSLLHRIQWKSRVMKTNLNHFIVNVTNDCVYEPCRSILAVYFQDELMFRAGATRCRNRQKLRHLSSWLSSANGNARMTSLRYFRIRLREQRIQILLPVPFKEDYA
uniref:Uncharacterized protein n=1 Tax=Strigamia maritima TaxID=126957 RepID=T1J2W8_STRMM